MIDRERERIEVDPHGGRGYSVRGMKRRHSGFHRAKGRWGFASKVGGSLGDFDGTPRRGDVKRRGTPACVFPILCLMGL